VNIDIEIAKKVLSTIDSGLTSGVGNPVPGQMCVEAAVCYALGLPHGDDPGCVSQALRSLKITLNDAEWSSDAARAKGLRRLGLAQLGSKDALNEIKFAEKVSLLVLNISVADALRLAAKDNSSLLRHAEACAAANNLSAASDAVSYAASAAASYAASYAVSDASAACAAVSYAASDASAASAAVSDAASAASAAASYAVSDAASAARAAARAASAAARAASAAVSYAASDAASDAVLIKFAEGVVQILIEMKAPGVQWLSLTEET